jgi:hypothetical protein
MNLLNICQVNKVTRVLLRTEISLWKTKGKKLDVSQMSPSNLNLNIRMTFSKVKFGVLRRWKGFDTKLQITRVQSSKWNFLPLKTMRNFNHLSPSSHCLNHSTSP